MGSSIKSLNDFPIQIPQAAESFTPDEIMQNPKISDRDLFILLYRDFAEDIAFAALEHFKRGELARRAFLEIFVETVSNRQEYWGDVPLTTWIDKIQERVFRRIEWKLKIRDLLAFDTPTIPEWDRVSFISFVEKANEQVRSRRRAIRLVSVAIILAAFIFIFTRQLVQVSQPRKMFEVLPVQTSYTQPPSILVLALILVGSIIGMAALFWLLRRSPIGRLYALLLGWMVTMILFVWSMGAGFPFSYGIVSMILISSPPIVLPIMVNVYLWFNRHIWDRRTWLLSGAIMIAILFILFNPWLIKGAEGYLFDRITYFLIIGLGILPLLIWLILSLPGYWKIISVLFAATWFAVGIGFILANYSINAQIQGRMVDVIILGGYLYPLFAGTLLGWLIYSGLQPKPGSRQCLWLRTAIGLLFFISLFAIFWMIAINTNFIESYSTLVILMLYTTLIGLFVAAVAIVLRLAGPRRRLGLGLLLLILLGLVPIVVLSYTNLVDPVNDQRSVLIDEAIQRYHQANGIYPPSLEALSPGYLLIVPRPATYLTQEWCYVSGGDYYRLGYPYPGRWTYPGEVTLKELSGGNLPAGKSECEKELDEWKQHVW